jgi:hypothetical protein
MEFEQLVHLANIILNLILGVGAVPLISWICKGLSLNVRLSQLVTTVVAVVIATLTLLVEGVITELSFEPERFVELLIAVLTASQAEYNRLKRKGRL